MEGFWQTGASGPAIMDDVSERDLKQRLIDRIRSEGPISFAEFMEAALYDPEDGFYARPPIGPDGHFVTSPHVSGAFGALVARQVGQVWDLLGKPDRMAVVEVGAGDGTLARQILEGVAAVPELASAVGYVAVERSGGARSYLADIGVEVRSSLEDLSVEGCVLANEVIDNLPFRRVRRRAGRTVEVLVGADDGRLVEVEGEPDPRLLERLPAQPEEGEERPVSEGAAAFVHQAAAALRRGYCFLFDYGFAAGERPGPVHAYRDHRVLADTLEDPGGRDVTAAVDLQALAQEAAAAGLSVWGPITQRDALLGLGFRTWMSGLRSRQAEAQLARAPREAARLYSERQRASILVDPAKLGGLRLLVFGTRGLPPPAAALGDRRSGC
jgi:SAM-dependent MidA family methyltransferase